MAFHTLLSSQRNIARLIGTIGICMNNKKNTPAQPQRAGARRAAAGAAQGDPAQQAKPRPIPLAQLLEADWNANRVAPAMLAKIRRSLVEFGLVENLVARPHPNQAGAFE